ncbi:hypothetical protein BPTFM16_02875 [Altererythrobacter insulae]|nr:hypothetical protein BPTFM16_02875 [Altererythrobacter insulae]
MYLKQNKIDKALLHAKEAFSLAPEIPNIADTYGQVLLQAGDNKEALKYASKAFDLTQGKDSDIALNYVEVLIANSHFDEAKVTIKKIVTNTTEQSDKKTQLLSRL